MQKNQKKVEEYFVVKVDGRYFSDVYDVYLPEEEEQNYVFTDDIEKAFRFHDNSLEETKYFWKGNQETAIRTLEEARVYLGGEVVKVTKRSLITWEEKTVGTEIRK